VLLFCTGHLIPGGDEEAEGLDGIVAVLDQCRAQNRQLISEMREFIFALCTL